MIIFFVFFKYLDTHIFLIFFFGVYTPKQPKAMQCPCSLPFKGLVHSQENGLHKRPAFRAKEISNEIPLFRRHTHYRSIPELVYTSASTPLLALPLQRNTYIIGNQRRSM